MCKEKKDIIARFEQSAGEHGVRMLRHYAAGCAKGQVHSPAWLQTALQSLKLHHQNAQPVLVAVESQCLDQVSGLLSAALACQAPDVALWQVPQEAVAPQNAAFFSLWRGLLSASSNPVVVVAPKSIVHLTSSCPEKTRFADVFRIISIN